MLEIFGIEFEGEFLVLLDRFLINMDLDILVWFVYAKKQYFICLYLVFGICFEYWLCKQLILLVILILYQGVGMSEICYFLFQDDGVRFVIVVFG